jgi:flagellar motor switch protein FliN/FliY
LQKFVSAFCQVCTTLLRQKQENWSLNAGDEGTLPLTEGSTLWFMVATSAAAGGAALKLSQSSLATLAQVLLDQSGPSDTRSGEVHVRAVQDLLQHGITLAAHEVGVDVGAVQVKYSAQEPVWQAADSVSLVAADGPSSACPLGFYFSAEWIEMMNKTNAGRTAGQLDGALASAASLEDTLGLIMDVDLEVTLRFGRRRLSLKEILGLAPGAVVELENHLQDPVELLLGEKVMARGEVVVVDGNYGVRVTECPPSIPSMRQ